MHRLLRTVICHAVAYLLPTCGLSQCILPPELEIAMVVSMLFRGRREQLPMVEEGLFAVGLRLFLMSYCGCVVIRCFLVTLGFCCPAVVVESELTRGYSYHRFLLIVLLHYFVVLRLPQSVRF